MTTKSLFLLVVFGMAWTATQLPQRPRVYIHGLGVSCDNLQLNQFDPTLEDLTEVMNQQVCIETGADMNSLFTPLEKQAAVGCDALIELIFPGGKLHRAFQYGFHLYGLSQGGLVVRLIYQNCPKIFPYVATLTFDGSPMLGIYKFPKLFKETDTEVKHKRLIKIGAKIVELWSKAFLSKRKYSVLQYLGRKKTPAKLIKQLNTHPTFTFANLERLNVVLYQQETVIFPRSSTGLGVDVQLDGEWQQFSESPLYSKFGLEQMWKEHRLVLATSAGLHVTALDKEREDLEFLVEDHCESTHSMTEVDLIRNEYRKCMPKSLSEKVWLDIKVQLYHRSKGVTLPRPNDGAPSLDTLMIEEDVAEEFRQKELEKNSKKNFQGEFKLTKSGGQKDFGERTELKFNTGSKQVGDESLRGVASPVPLDRKRFSGKLDLESLNKDDGGWDFDENGMAEVDGKKQLGVRAEVIRRSVTKWMAVVPETPEFFEPDDLFWDEVELLDKNRLI
jgi:hypothetical protein